MEKAALKAARIQEKELEEVTRALTINERGRIIYGDRFMRWTVLAYTLSARCAEIQPYVPE